MNAKIAVTLAFLLSLAAAAAPPEPKTGDGKGAAACTGEKCKACEGEPQAAHALFQLYAAQPQTEATAAETDVNEGPEVHQ